MFTNELDKLIIEHIADLDEGAKRLQLISSKVGDAIDSVVQDWAAAHGWIAGDGGWNDDNDTWVCLPSWRTDEDTWLAYFGLDFAGADDGEWSEEKDYFWLTRLCAEGRGSMGFRFFQSEFGKTPWKKFLSQRADLFEGTRFVMDDLPSVFLPVKVDRQALSAAVENENIAEALEPIVEALDLLAAELAKFEKLRQQMRERQGTT